MVDAPLIEFPISRQDKEGDKAWAGFKTYCKMGSGRSFAGLVRQWEPTNIDDSAPALSTVKGWSSRFKWLERVREYDAAQEAHQLQVVRAEREHKWLDEAEKCRKRRHDLGILFGDVAKETATIYIVKTWGDRSSDPKRQALIEKYQHIDLDQAIKMMGMATKVADAGANAEKDALRIEKLLQSFED